MCRSVPAGRSEMIGLPRDTAQRTHCFPKRMHSLECNMGQQVTLSSPHTFIENLQMPGKPPPAIWHFGGNSEIGEFESSTWQASKWNEDSFLKEGAVQHITSVRLATNTTLFRILKSTYESPIDKSGFTEKCTDLNAEGKSEWKCAKCQIQHWNFILIQFNCHTFNLTLRGIKKSQTRAEIFSIPWLNQLTWKQQQHWPWRASAQHQQPTSS